jgi:hypothetical protein
MPASLAKTIGFAAAMLITACGVFPARATGGFGCEATDKNVKFETHAGMQRGGAGSILNFEAQLEILLKNTPPDFRKLDMKSDTLSQHWLDGKEFKLRLYTERNEGLFGAVEFLIETKAADEGTYKGRYTLKVENMESEKSSEAKTLEARGKITCFVE